MMAKFNPIILDEDCAPRRVLELFSVEVDHDGAPLAALQRRHVPDRRAVAEPTGVLEEDAHADATRDGTGQADRSEGLSGCPADGRILPDAHGPALHRADRNALWVGGPERRRVI